VAVGRDVRALVARDEEGELAGYVTFLTDGETAEVEQAYVSPALRGHGTGGALVAAAARVGGASETFIIADDEGDPKRLYERLGFRPVWIQYELTRRPR
jgi:GNAT superfamily N-acetyltransferase